MSSQIAVGSCFNVLSLSLPRSLLLWLGLLLSCTATAQQPPYEGTVFIDPDLILSSDPSTFNGLVATGSGTRNMFDRRLNAFANFNAFLFEARFEDEASIEIQVNPEFGSAAEAFAIASFYARVIGQLPRALRSRVRTVWLHKGDEVFGGGNDNLLIHHGQIARGYIDSGVLEEVLIHEAVHTSLDPVYQTSAGWLAAQSSDNRFLSVYGRDNPSREDMAESFGPYFAVRFRPERISAAMKATIEQTMPARIAYFDSLSLNMLPTRQNATGNDQYWVTGAAAFAGNTLTVNAASAHGGAFGPSFDPARIVQPAWGTVTVRFTSCSTAELSYQSNDPKFGNGGYSLVRLPSPAQARCEQQGFGSGGDRSWAAGAWFGGASRSGEGLLIEVLNNDIGFVAWFTYGVPRL